ncbi:MAG TPA: aminotransferase class IV [Planctomycetota bacterium]|nr:aminotransferase class IV [Planctomycetota bacterium]HRR82112.1 aminotransferase class IV [Planctomycetota bacterium]HRT92893.1 aminotransferase class IV [Planctomycetota bacterium]
MSISPSYVYVNGEYLRADAPAVGASDRGLLYGDGLFETLRAYDGVPFLLDEHLARLNASATVLRLGNGVDPAAIRIAVTELLHRNCLQDAYLRITLTRGAHTGQLDLAPPSRPTLTIVARPHHPLPPSRYDPGSTAIIASIRQNADSPLPRHKTLNYLANLWARAEARERGADDAILLNTRGEVAEATSSNLFLVASGTIVTPSLEANILPGITRAVVLALARRAGYNVSERVVRPDELCAADELFLTNSVGELVPIRAIEGRSVGQGRPGEVTCGLHRSYRDCVRTHILSGQRAATT